MNRTYLRIGALLMAGILCLPAAAWGPRTEITVVNTAMHLYSKEQNVPLNRRAKDVQKGASVSMEKIESLYDDLAAGPINAIETEMALLQSVYENNLDPYFAYRLGALGKLVASLTAPMREADPAYRDQYYEDADRNIANGVSLQPSRRRVIDAALYFNDRMREAEYNDTLILEDYRSGAGFSGLAQRLLEEDAGRSIRAVADVWYTIFSGPGVQANVSTSQKRAFVLDAYSFYTQRKNPAEIDAVSTRLAKITEQTTDMQVAIADMLYEVELYERAIQRYQRVLNEDPSRRDVVEKISNYYVDKGDDYLEDGKLEEALESYVVALDTNPLHPEAEGKRIETARRIEERDARLEANRQLIARAQQFADLAEQEAARNRFAETIGLLREAEVAFSQVTDEFSMEALTAKRGLQEVRLDLDRFKGRLVENAQQFSGSGFELDAAAMARRHGREIDEAGLRALVEQGFQEELRALEAAMQPELRITEPES